MEMDVTHWGMHYSHQQKIPNYCPTGSSAGFVYGTTVVCQKTAINFPQKFQHRDQHFIKQGHLDEICSKCGAAKCMNIRAANKN
jgi:hypothetical protein